MDGMTIGWTEKPCVRSHTVAHELGHNFGANHDTATDTSHLFNYGHGHLIEKGNASMGYNTIMAYGRSGYSANANYYSNPDVIHPVTGTPTGVEGVEGVTLTSSGGWI